MNFLCHSSKLFDVYRFYLLTFVGVSQMHQVVLNVHQQFHAVTFVSSFISGKLFGEKKGPQNCRLFTSAWQHFILVDSRNFLFFSSELVAL